MDMLDLLAVQGQEEKGTTEDEMLNV